MVSHGSVHVSCQGDKGQRTDVNFSFDFLRCDRRDSNYEFKLSFVKTQKVQVTFALSFSLSFSFLSWLVWNSLYGPGSDFWGRPQKWQKSTCLCLLSAGTKGNHHQSQLGYSLGKNCFVDDVMGGGWSWEVIQMKFWFLVLKLHLCLGMESGQGRQTQWCESGRASRSWSSPSIKCVPGTKFRSSGLVTRTFSCWAISLAPSFLTLKA